MGIAVGPAVGRAGVGGGPAAHPGPVTGLALELKFCDACSVSGAGDNADRACSAYHTECQVRTVTERSDLMAATATQVRHCRTSTDAIARSR
jgi:hypothetical protein